MNVLAIKQLGISKETLKMAPSNSSGSRGDASGSGGLGGTQDSET